MGGKHKQAQRVKNNARPSSSGRSAERLGAALPAPFAATFAVHKDVSSFGAPLDDPIPQLDPALDPQFQLVLKKMNKKDGTTKLKALQEFRQLVETSDAEAVCLVTGLWCRVYVGLLGGSEGRVREAAHRAHEVVCSRAARSLAPHVRLLAAPWLAAQHDTYGPAAQAARDSLEAAFPDKQRRTELAARCRRQLLQQALEALGTEPRDERLVSCALRAAAGACEREDDRADEEQADLLRRLLEYDRFWQLATDECVRVGWAAMLAVACRSPWLEAASVNCGHVMRAVLPALWDSAAPDAATYLWDVVLLLLPTCGDDSTLNLRNNLLVPLCKQLSDPGPTVVTRTCPALLPLLARLPTDLATEAAPKLFSTLLDCMKRPNVQHSRAELSAAAAAYMDLAQWAGDSKAPAEFAADVLCSEPAPRHVKVLHEELSKLVRRWREGETADNVWKHLSNLVDQETINRCQLANLIVSLAKPSDQSKSTQRRVTFGGDCGNSSPASPVTVNKPTKNDSHEPQHVEKVRCLAERAVNSWKLRCDDPQTVTALISILREIGVNRVMKPGSPLHTYNTCVLPALNNSTTEMEQLIELAFLLLGSVEKESDRRATLESLPMLAVPNAVHLAQHEPHSRDIAFAGWLRTSPQVGSVYLQEAHNIASSDVDCKTSLLKRALLDDLPLCNEDCLKEVIEILCAALDAGHNKRSVCGLAATACRFAPDRLAPRLLTVACSTEARDALGPQLSWDVDTAWKDALLSQPELLQESLITTLHAAPCDESTVACGACLAFSLDDPVAVLSCPEKLKEVVERLQVRVALAQHVFGHASCGSDKFDKREVEMPTDELLDSWLGWWRVSTGALTILLADPDNWPDDEDKHNDVLDRLVVHALSDFSLVLCHTQIYTYMEHSERVYVWLDRARDLCKQLIELRPLTETSWWSNAPSEKTGEMVVVSWAACTCLLLVERLLPGAEATLGLHSPHAVYVAQAAAALGLLDPRRARPPGLGPLQATQLAVAAADEEEAISTAIAEAKYALHQFGAEPSDKELIPDACLLLEKSLLHAPDDGALLDLATVRVGGWANLAASAGKKNVRLLSAYCRLACAHNAALSGERLREHEQLFAADVQRVVRSAFTVLVELAVVGDPVSWLLCRAVGEALRLVSGQDELWRMALRALSEARCVEVQLVAHRCLRELCEAGAAEEGQAPPLLAAELLRLQDTDCGGDGQEILGYVLLWDVAAVLHAAWEQPGVDLFLTRLLELVPKDARDEWFEPDGEVKENTVERLVAVVACRAWGRWLCEAGAAARTWWTGSGLSAGDARRAEQLAARHVTRRAIKRQLAAGTPDGVRCTCAGRLLQAECRVEDARIELCMELGEAWPLGRAPPRLEARPAPHRDRLMQLTLAAAAGAPLHRLLRLWKDAVDRRYEGLDECHICFSLLHAATAQLPKLRCPTCRKTFHSACLYRWFSTSNKSTCPICRNLF